MKNPSGWRSAHRQKNSGVRRAWCCAFGAADRSPDRRSSIHSHHRQIPSKPPQKPPPFAAGSFHSSPSPSSKLGLGIIDPRRILSPGRVSPIDSDAPLGHLPEIADAASIATAAVESEPESSDPLPKERTLVPERPVVENGAGLKERSLDLRLSLKGKDGRCMVWELDSEVLCESSAFFASMVLNSGENASDALDDCRKIEVTDVEDLGVFGEAIELMYEKDATRWLMKVAVSRAIDILEVCSTIMFDRGIASCLKYIEAVPWSESDEEKLKSWFARYKFDEAISQDVQARLFSQGPNHSEVLALQLIRSVANGVNSDARKEMQFFVSGLLSKSSVYQKDPAGLNKESLYNICQSCLNSLVELFEEASNSGRANQTAITKQTTKPLIERVSKQVGNINWLLEILVDKQMAEDFVRLWASQDGLIRMHDMASPMVRYELSRISASVFIALGRGRLQCRGNMRSSVLGAWFGPLLVDYGWLRRCPKGLDMRMLEESLGQALLTLPLKQQQSFFEEWFQYFVCHGSGCPNLGKAFQVWWRRSFVRSSEAHS
uniref:LOW QUALITY PROTEIN: BTB/POZ domain-containing protein At2g13690-like n=1 Tax=Elaeis guineensis var. tenera TaxID=51953 RepID=A0A6I9R6Z9_ELAGV|nr:LOW QUALITY PROTEIN: BTB/POZ domain-containing protein At2g13690-like [Elaeis guineensis]